MSNKRFVASIGFCVLTLSVCVNPQHLFSQAVNGTILGVVQDEQGAAIAKAQISARNLETGVIREVAAEDNGEYRILSVPAGSYEVSSSATGFKTELRTGIVVTVGGDISVNFALSVGAVTERIEVQGEAAQVDTVSSAVSALVNSATIGELPLNGRDWLQLSLLQPGVSFNTGQTQTDGNRPQRGNGVSMSITGGRDTDNAFRIDGLIVNDYANAGPGSALHVNLGVDAIREFSVLTSSYSAEYPGSGGVVNAITKSGTNRIHGSAYEFVRNSAFDARNFFDGKTIPPFRRDQYGGSVGGPIRKDKTFYFVNYEKLGQLRSLSASFSTLSANAHNGLVCANSACTQTTQIAINPAVVPYLALYPLPNAQVTGDTGIFAFGQTQHGEETYVIGKFDHYFTSSTTLSASYSYDDTTEATPDDFNLKLSEEPSRRQNGVVSLQHIFSSNVIDTARAGVSRTYAGGNIDCCATNPALTDLALGFIPGRNMGAIAISGVTGVFGGIGTGLEQNGLSIFGYTVPQAYNDLSWIKGRHSIRMGFSFQRIDYNLTSDNKPNGVWTFPSVQSFLQGIPSQFAADFPGTSEIRAMRMSVIGGYIQDDFRMAPNFTINVGLRYEMGTVVTEANGLLSNLRNLTDPKSTVGNPYYNNPTLKNFAPRLGFAWDPFKDGKTSVRAGFGMYDIIPLPFLFQNRIPRTLPFFEAGVLNNPPASSFPDEALALVGPSSLTTTHVEFNPRRSYKLQWNYSIQRQLTRNLALTVGYVGSAGVHLASVIQDADQVPQSLATFSTALDSLILPVPAKGQKTQRVNPNFAQIQSSQWSGHSSYNALQINLIQRPIRGLYYQFAYTWSKSMDDGTTANSQSEVANTAGPAWAFDPNRGVSDFNIPHNFVANFQYDLPVPGALKAHPVSNAIFGGWQVGGIYTIQTGSPFTLKIAADPAFTGSSVTASAQGAERPQYIAATGCSPDAITGNINNYIMTQCFAFPVPGQLGNLGRNTLHMPVFRDMDFSVFKNQNLWGEKLRLQFRAEAFNIFNNVNLQAQTRTIFNGSGGLLPTVGTALGPTVNTSRQIQLGVRLLF